MPEMDGLTLATEIRRRTRTLPLIMLTSVGRQELAEPDSTSEFAAILTKPIKPSKLYNALVGVFAAGAVRDWSPPKHESIKNTKAARLPLRILIAEDNAINQKVLLKILQSFGYRADVVANGIEAIEAVTRQPYDILFMDVQMPQMGGLEATRRICERFDSAHRPRIVAMTASAMEGDKETCIEAGMDDYVSKPVRIKILQASLERWGNAVSTSRAQQESVAASASIDLEIINDLRRLQDDTDTNILLEMVELFREDAPGHLRAIADAIANSDAGALEHAAHRLRGSSASLGAVRLAELCKSLEQLGRSNSTAGAVEKLTLIEAEMTCVTAALEFEAGTETVNETVFSHK